MGFGSPHFCENQCSQGTNEFGGSIRIFYWTSFTLTQHLRHVVLKQFNSILETLTSFFSSKFKANMNGIDYIHAHC